MRIRIRNTGYICGENFPHCCSNSDLSDLTSGELFTGRGGNLWTPLMLQTSPSGSQHMVNILTSSLFGAQVGSVKSKMYL